MNHDSCFKDGQTYCTTPGSPKLDNMCTFEAHRCGSFKSSRYIYTYPELSNPILSEVYLTRTVSFVSASIILASKFASQTTNNVHYMHKLFENGVKIQIYAKQTKRYPWGPFDKVIVFPFSALMKFTSQNVT